MTFQAMFDQAKSLGFTPENMRSNCQKQLANYETYAEQKLAGESQKWLDNANQCRGLLAWLDERC